MTDVCCLQEVRWRGQGVVVLWMKGSTYVSFGGLEKEMELVACEIWYWRSCAIRW